MADPAIAYSEDEEVVLTEAELPTWKVEGGMEGKGLVAHGKCPACGHDTDGRLDAEVVISVKAGESAGDSTSVTRMLHCVCRGHPHDGRPEKLTRGCGRRWALTAVRGHTGGWGPALPPSTKLVEAARSLDAASLSLPAVRASAEKWLPGITALYALLGLAGVVTGRDAVKDLSTTGRLGVLAALAVGFTLAALAVWFGYGAAYGWPKVATLKHDEALLKWAQERETTGVRIAPALMARAVRCAVASAAALLVGVGISWLGPTPSVAKVKVTYRDEGVTGRAISVCGDLRSPSGSALRVAERTGLKPVVVRIEPGWVDRIEPAAKC